MTPRVRAKEVRDRHAEKARLEHMKRMHKSLVLYEAEATRPTGDLGLATAHLGRWIAHNEEGTNVIH